VTRASRILLLLFAFVLAVGGYFALRGPKTRLRLPTGARAPSLSLGESHGLVLAPDGSLWVWGSEDRGWPILGLPGMTSTPKLVRLGSETNWVCASAGDDHSLAMKADGTIWAWGANYRGQLGDGNTGRTRTNGAATPNLQPRPVLTVAASNWVQVIAGSVNSYALKRDGSLWAWGLNNFCQLGINSWVDSPRPVQVGTATNWVKVCAGGVSAGGIQSDGSLWIWGGSPKLGNTVATSPQNLLVPTRLTPDTNWVDVSVAFNIWMAVKSEGTLWAWGRIAHTFTGASTNSDEMPMQMGTETNWLSVWSSGGGFAHLLKKRDGSYWLMDSPDSPRKTMRLQEIDLPAGVVAVDIGGGAVAAVTKQREVWACGTVFGHRTVKDRMFESVEKLGLRLGWWKSPIGLSRSTKVTRDHPWPLQVLEPGSSKS
jgi:alpha-tubulin suppressor-like RCC1 family protein